MRGLVGEVGHRLVSKPQHAMPGDRAELNRYTVILAATSPAVAGMLVAAEM